MNPALDPLEDGRLITHEQARNSVRRFIDEHFNNEPKYGRVKTCIPVEPDDDDTLLMRYVTQQEARAARERELREKLADVLEDVKFLDKYAAGRTTKHDEPVWDKIAGMKARIEAALSETQPGDL